MTRVLQEYQTKRDAVTSAGRAYLVEKVLNYSLSSPLSPYFPRRTSTRRNRALRLPRLLLLLSIGRSSMSLLVRARLLSESFLSVRVAEGDPHGRCAEGTIRDQEGRQSRDEGRALQCQLRAICIVKMQLIPSPSSLTARWFENMQLDSIKN